MHTVSRGRKTLNFLTEPVTELVTALVTDRRAYWNHCHTIYIARLTYKGKIHLNMHGINTFHTLREAVKHRKGPKRIYAYNVPHIVLQGCNDSITYISVFSFQQLVLVTSKPLDSSIIFPLRISTQRRVRLRPRKFS